MQGLLSSENSLLGDAIFRGTFSLYLDKKFSDTFLKSVVDTMSKGDRERINCFLKEFKCNDDFSFENLNIIVKIYNNHIDGTDNYLEKIEENYLNKLQQVECSYLNICNSLKTNKNYLRDLKQKSEQLLQSRPIFEVVGNLHYLMTIDEIKENLASSLKNVRILDPYEFSNLNFCDQWFECKSSDISRIFGAKYLKRKFSENNILSFDVPEFIIVTENYNLNSNKKNLKVKIHFGKDFPAAHSIFNAKIYSRKIIGYPVANQHQGNHILQHLGYIDLGGDDGNIIQDSTGTSFIVDTEAYSFDMRVITQYEDPLLFTKYFMRDCKDFLLFAKYYFLTTNNIKNPNIEVEVEV